MYQHPEGVSGDEHRGPAGGTLLTSAAARIRRVLDWKVQIPVRWLLGFAVVVIVWLNWRQGGEAVLKVGGEEASKEPAVAVSIPTPSSTLLSTASPTISSGIVMGSNGLPFRVCDNPITRRVGKENVIKAIEKRTGLVNKAFPWMYSELNKHIKTHNCSTKPHDLTCSRPWSGLVWDRARWVMFGDVVLKCPDLRAFGSGDDEKRFCWSDELVSGDTCMVFSIGGNNQWDFEQVMANKTKCAIHTFDCTITPRIPEDIKDRVVFHKICVGNSKSGPLYQSMDKLYELAGNKRVDFFKMDVEGFEYDVLIDMFDSAEQKLKETGVDILPNQMAIEFHYSSWHRPPFKGRDLSPGELYAFAELLFYRAGYVLADTRINPQCRECLEVLLVRIKC